MKAHESGPGKLVCKALILFAGLVASAWAWPSDRFSVMDIFELEFAFDPQISPDAKQVVYTRQYADIMTDARYSNLWILDVDGNNHRALTTGRQRDSGARWSPDGERIAYVSDRDGSAQIHVHHLKQGTHARITNLPRPPGFLAWSPDGDSIAYVSVVVDPPLKIVDLPSPPPGAKWHKERSRLYDRLVYRREQLGYVEGNTHAFVVPAEGGTPRQVTHGPFNHGKVGGPVFEGAPAIEWSAEGRSLIVAANRRPDHELEPFDSEVYEVSLVDGSMKALTDRRGPDTSPTVSPDGKHIAYIGFDDRKQNYQLDRLHVMDRDGGNGRVLLQDFDRSVKGPRWAADSKGIYFLYNHHGNTRLAHVSLQGEMQDKVSNVGPGYMNYGFGGSYTLAPDGSIAFTYTDRHTPGGVGVLRAGEDEAEIVLKLNDDLFGSKRLGSVEEMWFESSLDGQEIQSWILKPPDFDPGGNYPLVLEIHGGPTVDIGGDRFDVEKQLYAANGYVVLFMNPRGSTSYGERFGNLIYHSYPGDDYFDLVSGVDAIIERGYIDEDNLFITGGSGGGILTCWVIGRTDRFAAAVSQYPVINMLSFALVTDDPLVFNKYWFPGPPWEYPEQYWERSPLSLVGNVTTPTLMLAPMEDVITPPSEAEQFYTALKLRGIDTLLAHFPDEPHGVRIYPSHHMEKVLTILAWFEKYRTRPDAASNR